MSEIRIGPIPFSKTYAYDANGNRLTEYVNGSLTQQFTYDGHDKIASATGESETYDANGNLKTQTVGGQTTTFTWDDEDRLLSQTLGGHTDTYSYTGLGMRLTKADPTGNYSYLADGVSPASPMLTDGHTSFTPGISEYSTALGSRFYVADAQGNSRGLLDGTQAATDGYNWDAFGISMSRFGSNPTALAWGEGSGYQTDNDSGLKLLGHRYYDSRTGRFISQDPIGDGDNWYAYADNSPTNEDDPTGLFECQGWSFDQIYNEAAAEGGPGSSWETTQTDAQGNKTVIGQFMISDFNLGTAAPGAGMGGGGAFAQPFKVGNRTYRRYGGQQEHGNHVHREDGKRYNRDGKEVDGRERPLNRGNDVDGRLKDKFRKGFDREFPPEPAGGDEVNQFTRWMANRSDADLVGMSILGAGVVVGSYYLAPLLAPVVPAAAPYLVPLLAP